MAKKFTYGGQAVIEGVMIRGQTAAAVAVRRPNGQTVTTCEPLPNIYNGSMRKVPFIRGVLVLIETLVLGMRALMFSANVAMEEEETKPDKAPQGSKLSWLMMPVALTLAIGIFFVVPLLLARQIHMGSAVASALVEGVIRLALFLGYLSAISLMPDMRRVFCYHGAEHMTIAAHEHGEPLRLEHIRKYPKEHPRCGTAFLLTVVVVAVVLFAIVGIFNPPIWLVILSRIVLIPLIASVSYEVIRFNAAHENSLIGKAGMAPGLWMQRLTTRKPDDSQIEVAVAAMQAALAADGVATEPAQPASPSKNGVLETQSE